MPFDDIERFSKIGFVGILILILILLYKGKIRWGSDYDKLESERDRWMRAALKGTEIARHAVRVVDKASLSTKEPKDDEPAADASEE